MQRFRRLDWLKIVLAVVCFWTQWIAQSARAQTSQPTASAVQAQSAKVDLADPRVRERLRAAGVDPEDLAKLLAVQQGEQDVQSTAAPAPNSLFPPVTQPEMVAPVELDSTAVSDSSATDPDLSQYFGYNIFKASPKTFEPLAFGPVSPDYLLGPGDEIIVNVWGHQEMNAKVEVNREGYILLPDLGQVLVNGFTLGGLKANLEQRFSKIYSGVRSDGDGRTFLDVTLGKLRSVQIFVLGDVVQPGGYTMSATSTVMNALYYAGGPTLQGSMRSVRLLRNNKLVREIDLYDYVAQGDRTEDKRLENGDVVFVPPAGIRVELHGEVQHPANYELKHGETLADLLSLAGGLKSTAYVERVQIERVIPFEDRQPMSQEDRRILDVALDAQSARPGDDVQLVDGDVVQIFAVGDILKNTVKLLGSAVYKPGTYEHRAGMTIADLVATAGGLLGDAYTRRGHLVRTHADKARELLAFDLGAALKRDPKHNLRLQELDQVQVFSVWEIRDREYVRIEGVVRKPGRYELLAGMTVSDLVVRAGGLKESAYRVRAEISRINPEAISAGKTAELIQVALSDHDTPGGSASAFPLLKNDIVFVREIPNWGLQENVWITGEVRFPGMYTLTSKVERLSSIIQRAGGLEPTAYLRGATIVRKKNDTGRMALDFEAALKERKNGYNKFDMVMAGGDSIHIPLEPTTVKVTGQVGFPSSVLWEEGRKVDHYVEQAGGLLDSADRDKIRVVMANGRVARPGWFSSPEPDAGATIIVPAKLEKRDGAALENIAKIVSILSGAATTIYLISRTN